MSTKFYVLIDKRKRVSYIHLTYESSSGMISGYSRVSDIIHSSLFKTKTKAKEALYVLSNYTHEDISKIGVALCEVNLLEL